jgi:XTP/dITP diphosphohydrolase
MTVWFATGNPHKRNELSAIFRPIVPGLEIKIPPEAGIEFDPDENGGSFAENALIKARTLYRLAAEKKAEPVREPPVEEFPIPVIADDSGLCVDALDGRPGIYSARYGGEGGKKASARESIGLLLKELGNNTNRKARFVCAMVCMFRENRFFLVQETCEGELVKDINAARGSGGFGFDPVFFIPSLGRTMAELSENEKNIMSHRGKAGRIIAQILSGAREV